MGTGTWMGSGVAIRRCLPPVVWLAITVPLLAAPSQPLAAQAALDRRAGLNVEGAGVEQALRLLRRSAGVGLLYSPDLIPADRIVTCPCENVTVRQALERILEGTGLTFAGNDRQIRIVPAESPAPAALAGVMVGFVTGSGGERVPGARIQLGDGRHVFSDADGAFVLRDVRPGTHRLTVMAMGWATRLLEGLEVVAGDTLRLTILLDPEAISLADIRVAPGMFSALEDVSPQAVQVLSREEILTMPQVGEDVFRSMKRLPGVAAHDISTRLNVRGGTDREVLIRLDGIELYEPYHMKDWDGALGIVDLNALGGVELSAGGFGVEHGDRMAGVFDMRSRTAVGPRRTTLGMSITNLNGMSRGGFAGDRGSWLVSARRGFMGLVIRLIGEDRRLSPQYWDVFGKVSYEPAPGNLVSAHVLHAGDAFGLHALAEVERVDVSTEWRSSYGWVTWESALRRGVQSDLTLWTGRVTRDRMGLVEDLGRPGMPDLISAADDRTFTFAGVRDALSIQLGRRAMVKLGAEARSLRAAYAYSASTWTEMLDPDLNPVVSVDSTAVALDPRGTQLAGWAALRVRPWNPITLELGARYDRVTHTGDEDVSPRVLASLELDAVTTLRGSWGRYYQSQGIQELAVGDGEIDFFPAERAEQIALGLERSFGSHITARAEAYYRTIADQRPRYLNLEQELEIFPEAEGDRLRIDPARGRARGLELVVERKEGGRWAWSASYVLAIAEDEVPDLFGADCQGGRPCSDRLWVPRRFDQRHAVALHASYTPAPRWNVSVGWRYHSGWPATSWRYRVEQLDSGRAFWIREFGPMRQLRLPAYHRLDLRVTRDFRVRGNSLHAYVDFFNFYDRTNLASYEFGGTFVGGRMIMERRNGQTLLPFLPTFGLRYEF
ncbi:MAG: TonB-dependent receptor [Gemmatimonadota bacterium]